MADAVGLNELVQDIRANLPHWDQGHFARGDDVGCGTTMCAAGMYAAKRGYQPTLNGIGFETSSWWKNGRGDKTHPASFAAEGLGLTHMEMDALFYASADMTDIDEYESLVQAVADDKLNEWVLTTDGTGFDYLVFKADWADTLGLESEAPDDPDDTEEVVLPF